MDTHTQQETRIGERVRLKAALALFEEMLLVLDSMPAITDECCAEGRAMRRIKHKIQHELLRAWKLGDI